MKRGHGVLVLGIALLISLNGLACFRGLSASKIKCDSPESCPSGYFCAMGDAGYGSCLPSQTAGTTGAGGVAGGGGIFPGANDAGMGGDARGATGGTVSRDFDGGVGPDGRMVADVSTAGILGGNTGTAGGASGIPQDAGVAGATAVPGGTVETGGAGGGAVAGAMVGAGAVAGAGPGGTSSTVVATSAPGGNGGTTGPIDAPVAPPDAPVNPGLKALGVGCGDRTECESGFCADGVCCTAACTGNCETCSAAGKCTPVAKGPAPASRTACGGTGVCTAQCDGVNGATCVFPDDKVICTAASCKDGVATTASVCHAGSCSQASTAPCSSNLCADASKCAGSCAKGTCGPNKFCDTTAGVCMATKSPGTACRDGEECGTGFCVDSVCCESECKDQCTACNQAGSCVRISGEPKSPRTPCTKTDAKCAGRCDLTSNSCVYPGDEVTCTAASCSADQSKRNLASTCYQGACTSPSSVPCTGGTYCSGGACVDQTDIGGGCGANIECKSNFCTSVGMCCATGNITCLGVCKDGQTDPSNCGDCGKACGSNQTCSGGQCRCSGASLVCGTTTVCTNMGFEDGLFNGWSVDSTTYANAAGPISVVTGRAHGGSMSLLVSTYYDTSNYHYGDLVFPLCSSGTAAVSSYSLWVYVDSGSMGTTGSSRLTFYNASGAVVSTTTPSTPLPSGGWVNLTGSVSGGPVQASKVQVRFQPTTFDTYGSGRLWIDDIEWK